MRPAQHQHASINVCAACVCLQAFEDWALVEGLTDALCLLMHYSLHAAFPLFWFLSKVQPPEAVSKIYLDVLHCAAKFLMHVRK